MQATPITRASTGRINILLPFGLALLVACEPANTGAGTEQVVDGEYPDRPEIERWYSAAQVSQGFEIFQANCASCHGSEAEGLAEDWRERDSDGNYPAPPLNGSAHAWHHPLPQLEQLIETGGQIYGGQMPSFAEILDAGQRRAAIAYFQSYWSDDIYLDWLDMGGLQ